MQLNKDYNISRLMTELCPLLSHDISYWLSSNQEDQRDLNQDSSVASQHKEATSTTDTIIPSNVMDKITNKVTHESVNTKDNVLNSF